MNYLFLRNHLGPRCIWKQDHNIIEVGRDLGRSSSPISHPKQSSEFRCCCLVSTVLLSLENFQTWWSHSLFGHPLPVLNYPHRADSFPYIPLNLSCFNLLPVCLVLLLFTVLRNSVFLVASSYMLESCYFLFSRLNKAHSFSLSSQVKCSSPQPSWWPSAGL